MEAGFKTEGFACFVSETSRNIYGKEQRLPKALQELLVSWWGCTQHIPQHGWPEFQRAPRVPGAAPLGAALPLFGSCMLEVGITNTPRFFTVMD